MNELNSKTFFAVSGFEVKYFAFVLQANTLRMGITAIFTFITYMQFALSAIVNITLLVFVVRRFRFTLFQ